MKTNHTNICNICDNSGWIPIRRPEFIFTGKYDEYYENLANKIGSIRAAYAQLCDMAFPKYTACNSCGRAYKQFKDMWE